MTVHRVISFRVEKGVLAPISNIVFLYIKFKQALGMMLVEFPKLKMQNSTEFRINNFNYFINPPNSAKKAVFLCEK